MTTNPIISALTIQSGSINNKTAADIARKIAAYDELVKALREIEALPKFGNKDFGQQVSLIARIALEGASMKFTINDGGRAAAGFKGNAGDCVTRAVAIASGRPYAEVYAALSEGCRTQRVSKRGTKKSSARDEVHTSRQWFKDYMQAIGFEWVPTMQIGSGCTVHLKADELPAGRLVVSVSRHCVAVIDGVLHDTHDPQREGRRCVYGYWRAV